MHQNVFEYSFLVRNYSLHQNTSLMVEMIPPYIKMFFTIPSWTKMIPLYIKTF